jgi:hypothetical protein
MTSIPVRLRLFAVVLAALAVVAAGLAAVGTFQSSSDRSASCTYHWVYTYGYRGWDYYWLCITDPSGGGGGGSW